MNDSIGLRAHFDIVVSVTAQISRSTGACQCLESETQVHSI